ncbi:hypothetical protein GCM10027167_71490 [Nocardia heshunensis]
MATITTAIALGLAGLALGGTLDTPATDVDGPPTCHEGFCRGYSGSDDMFWPWGMLLPTGSTGSA